MKIKELMAQVDLNRVTDAFLLLDYNFSAENFENSFIEKYEAVPKLRKIIEENIRLFAECTANDDIVPHTIFIMYSQDDENYENQWKKRFSGFAICDEEALSVIDKDLDFVKGAYVDLEYVGGGEEDYCWIRMSIEDGSFNTAYNKKILENTSK